MLCARIAQPGRGLEHRGVVASAQEGLRADLDLTGIAPDRFAVPQQDVALLGEGRGITGLVPAVPALGHDPQPP